MYYVITLRFHPGTAHKLHAIKVLRDTLHFGLKESKQLVELLEQSDRSFLCPPEEANRIAAKALHLLAKNVEVVSSIPLDLPPDILWLNGASIMAAHQQMQEVHENLTVA